MIKSAFRSRASHAACELLMQGVSWAAFLYRGIFSQKITILPQWIHTPKSVLWYPSKQHFSSHRPAKHQSASKLIKLPGASFCRILSRNGRWYDLPSSAYHQYFAARAPPRKSDLMPHHIQIFGGQVMRKTSYRDIQIKILVTTTLAVIVTLYHRPQSVMERGVSI